ncbi:MAG: response regulator [bacterium]
MANKPIILIIDDEIQIRRLLELTLETSGYKTIVAASGVEGLHRAALDRPHLIILDLGLPDKDGISVLKKLREWATFPVIILSVRDAESIIVECLDAGADDYLVKPFRSKELLARVRMALRHRPSVHQTNVVEIGFLTVDFEARSVKKRGRRVKLTVTEYDLLALFVRNTGRVLTHHYILEQVWGPSYAEETQYSRVFIAQLRKKLEDDPTRPTVFLTESGIGYRFAVE